MVEVTPLILLIYNRPDKVSRMLDVLQVFRPDPLIIFSDGPKNHKDAHAVGQCRDLIYGRVDWTIPNVVVRKENWGLAKSVVAAVDKVLIEYDRMVLLEDDCIPSPYFMDFMETCLNQYQNNPKILGVTGYTVPIPETIRKSYPWDLYVFPRPGSWGWATWRSAWKLYDRNFEFSLVEANWDSIDLTVGGKDIPGIIQRAIDGKLDVWTPGWLTAVARYGYFIYPTVSYIHNIGFDGTGVHCGKTNRYDNPIAKTKPTRFPNEVVLNKEIVENFRKYY